MQKPPPAQALPHSTTSDHGSPPGGLGPVLCGDIDMRIAADGTWYYGGSPIGRKELVTLFASVLVLNEDGYWLITPAEKAKIQVDDAPFAAVELTLSAEGDESTLTIRTNLDETVTLDTDHPLRIGKPDGRIDSVPYITVRDGLEARFTRAAYYDLVDHGVTEIIDGESLFGVWSAGAFFSLGSLDGESAS